MTAIQTVVHSIQKTFLRPSPILLFSASPSSFLESRTVLEEMPFSIAALSISSEKTSLPPASIWQIRSSASFCFSLFRFSFAFCIDILFYKFSYVGNYFVFAGIVKDFMPAVFINFDSGFKSPLYEFINNFSDSRAVAADRVVCACNKQNGKRLREIVKPF